MAQTKPATIHDLAIAVRRLAYKYPDFVYSSGEGNDRGYVPRCSFNHGSCDKYPDRVGCIVGQAVRELGGRVHDDNNFAGISAAIAQIPGCLPVDYDKDVTAVAIKQWLETVQSNQDAGQSWQQAVMNADLISITVPVEDNEQDYD